MLHSAGNDINDADLTRGFNVANLYAGCKCSREPEGRLTLVDPIASLPTNDPSQLYIVTLEARGGTGGCHISKPRHSHWHHIHTVRLLSVCQGPGSSSHFKCKSLVTGRFRTLGTPLKAVSRAFPTLQSKRLAVLLRKY